MPTSYPITACSAVNCLGSSVREVRQNLFAGVSGLRPADEAFAVDTYYGALPSALPALPPRLTDWDSRQARMCALAVSELLPATRAACARWGADRVGVVLGTSTGGIEATETAWAHHAATGHLPESYHVERQHALQASLRVVEALIGARGPGYVVSTACSSSGKVFASARRLLAAGYLDAVVVGGVDTLCKLTVRGFASLEVISQARCRPFAAERDGINIGEGGAFVLVERKGDAQVALFGVGESSDAHHMTSPHPDGLGAHLAMTRALEQAGIGADQIDHVNAHATGTRQNDFAEALGIQRLVGTHTPVLGTKGYTGHMLGAAGATEAIFTIAAIEDQRLPSSLGAEPVDPEIAVAVQTRATDHTTRFALSNSLAFGGSNVSVLFGRSL